MGHNVCPSLPGTLVGAAGGVDSKEMVEDGTVGAGASGGPPTVVVAAADVDLRRTVADILYDEGYVVTEVADGEVATDLLGTRRFDAVVLDRDLPRLDAMAVLAGAGAHPPVVVVAGPGDDAVDRRDLAVRGIASLVTPVDPEHLLDAVACAVSRAPAVAQRL